MSPNTPIVPDDPTREVVTTQGYLDALIQERNRAQAENALLGKTVELDQLNFARMGANWRGPRTITERAEEAEAAVERLTAEPDALKVAAKRAIDAILTTVVNGTRGPTIPPETARAIQAFDDLCASPSARAE